ncbi:unnamed protein product [Acanthoscelides obtectus]|uniref:Uncharacterized protein n=1 Tax=Acanthoscelides obtectus TaxID=200917 RepID=A0A9P0PKF1_ACAOB|nr:unnamed protein product [Acanthoscelides obtectus]CAK1652935.1 hypothetical protein AOBTE_LOCUS17976 [Acanthoscelides obtectus]
MYWLSLIIPISNYITKSRKSKRQYMQITNSPCLNEIRTVTLSNNHGTSRSQIVSPDVTLAIRLFGTRCGDRGRRHDVQRRSSSLRNWRRTEGALTPTPPPRASRRQAATSRLDAHAWPPKNSEKTISSVFTIKNLTFFTVLLQDGPYVNPHDHMKNIYSGVYGSYHRKPESEVANFRIRSLDLRQDLPVIVGTAMTRCSNP